MTPTNFEEPLCIGFGFRKFTHYRIRVLLYTGKPNWDLLARVTLC